MHVDVGMQSPGHKREGSPNIDMQTPVKRSKSMEDSQVLEMFGFFFFFFFFFLIFTLYSPRHLTYRGSGRTIPLHALQTTVKVFF